MQHVEGMPRTNRSPPPTDAKAHFAVAAASLTQLYKLAHLGTSGQIATQASSTDVRTFATMAAIEVPSAPERLRGRRFVPLDELLAFLDRQDERLLDDCDAQQHCFGRKRELPVDAQVPSEDRVVVPPNSFRSGAEGEGAPLVRRHRAGDEVPRP